ncbi:hypothetical protein [Shewanella halifaxensis]|uniref:hypothetical protein n=1 Tax=Shewanella halifaxensis TaxID=271098 RepID=UPI0013A60453|nr:hypothetical protein [Shewanella halifaxensis]
MLKEEPCPTTIYLNDRCYEILDVGEGDCLITLVKDAKKHKKQECKKQRTILLGVSKVLEEHSEEIEIIDKLLARDLNLLFDVFWLGKVEVNSEVKSIKMDEIYKMVNIREYSRLLKHHTLSN